MAALPRKISNDRRIDRVCRVLVRSGWEFISNGNHPSIKAPCGRRFSIPKTPSDHRAGKNWFADLKRAGYEVQA